MKSIIRKLYLGNVNPQEKTFEHNSKYGKALDIVAKNEEFLIELLTGKEKDLFLEYIDACLVVLDISTTESFVDGFRIGAAITLDTFVHTDNEFKDIT